MHKNSNGYRIKIDLVVEYHYPNSCNAQKQGVILWKLREMREILPVICVV